MLRVKGYEVYLGISGEEALERAGQREYRLVLLDASLPGMSGLTCCVNCVRADGKCWS